MPAWWDNAPHGTPWNPSPGPDQRYDYSVPLDVGTTVVSPVNGIVVGDNTPGVYAAYGRRSWGGEVDILTNLPDYGNEPVVVDIIHFDGIAGNIQPGTKVYKGDILGTSGGQLSGGNWPVSCCSTGPHVGVGVRSYKGFTPAWDPGTLVNHLLTGVDASSAPTIDQQYQIAGRPLAFLTAQQPASPPGGGPGGPIGTGGGGAVVGAVGTLGVSAVEGVIGRVFPSLNAADVLNLVIRIAKFAMGFILLSIASFVFFLPSALEATGVATGQPGLAEVGRFMQRRRKGATPQPAPVTINTGQRAKETPPSQTPPTTPTERTMYQAGVAAGRREQPARMQRLSTESRRLRGGMTKKQQQQAVESGLVQAPTPPERMSPEEEKAEQERQQRALQEQLNAPNNPNLSPEAIARQLSAFRGTPIEERIATLRAALANPRNTNVQQRAVWQKQLDELLEQQRRQP